jgi:restriction system protein
MKALIITLVILLLVFFFTGRQNVRKLRHRRRIKQAEKVLLIIQTFEGQFRDAQIFSYLRKINPNTFEELLLTSFEKKGYKVTRNRRYSGDGGFDGIINEQNGKKILIQAKRYKGLVNGGHIRNFSKLVEKKGAHKGYFIHTGRTSVENLQKAKGSNIEIISGQKLINLIL